MDKIQFPYRSDIHLQLLHVVAESGAWERHGLDVEYQNFIDSDDAHAAVLSGDADFVSGNHVSPYAHRARGDNWIYLGQTVNVVPGRKLVVRADSPIKSINDLREKKVGSRGSHPKLNDWLQLKQTGLDIDRDEVAVVDPAKGKKDLKSARPLWQDVLDGTIDAAILPCPQPFFAAAAGLKTIDVPDFPMIYFTTLSTSMRYVERHPDIIDRFLKGIIEGIHFFKTQPERTTAIIKERYKSLNGEMTDDLARQTQACLAEALEPKLYPKTAAIANVYELGVRQDKDAARINPMELWDLHALRRIDDSGFIDALYAPKATVA